MRLMSTVSVITRSCRILLLYLQVYSCEYSPLVVNLAQSLQLEALQGTANMHANMHAAIWLRLSVRVCAYLSGGVHVPRLRRA